MNTIGDSGPYMLLIIVNFDVHYAADKLMICGLDSSHSRGSLSVCSTKIVFHRPTSLCKCYMSLGTTCLDAMLLLTQTVIFLLVVVLFVRFLNKGV